MKGYIEKIEDGVATQLQPGFFAKGFAAATNSIVEALDRRRGFCDEMEKLIGVRQLDKHPDGINGGVIALLGITDKLAPESAARWKDFVIGFRSSLRFSGPGATKLVHRRCNRKTTEHTQWSH